LQKVTATKAAAGRTHCDVIARFLREARLRPNRGRYSKTAAIGAEFMRCIESKRPPHGAGLFDRCYMLVTFPACNLAITSITPQGATWHRAFLILAHSGSRRHPRLRFHLNQAPFPSKGTKRYVCDAPYLYVIQSKSALNMDHARAIFKIGLAEIASVAV
jgi:hypothetical protein